MHESDQDTKLEETETHVLTKTDPFKPHEGVPRQDEPENKKKNQDMERKLELIFWMNHSGLSLFLGSF